MVPGEDRPEAEQGPTDIEIVVKGPRGTKSDQHGPLRGKLVIEIYWDGYYYFNMDKPIPGDELARLAYGLMTHAERSLMLQQQQQARVVVGGAQQPFDAEVAASLERVLRARGGGRL